jgi:hypothetical protein
MRVTIIPSDGFVSIDGYGFSGLDLSGIDASVHAVQWYDTHGEVEVKDPVTRKMTANTEITSLEQFQAAIDIWNIRKEETLAAEAQALAEAQAAQTTPEPADEETT